MTTPIERELQHIGDFWRHGGYDEESGCWPTFC
jgi:hypothetical protein